MGEGWVEDTANGPSWEHKGLFISSSWQLSQAGEILMWKVGCVCFSVAFEADLSPLHWATSNLIDYSFLSPQQLATPKEGQAMLRNIEIQL